MARLQGVNLAAIQQLKIKQEDIEAAPKAKRENTQAIDIKTIQHAANSSIAEIKFWIQTIL